MVEYAFAKSGIICAHIPEKVLYRNTAELIRKPKSRHSAV